MWWLMGIRDNAIYAIRSYPANPDDTEIALFLAAVHGLYSDIVLVGPQAWERIDIRHTIIRNRP